MFCVLLLLADEESMLGGGRLDTALGDSDDDDLLSD